MQFVPTAEGFNSFTENRYIYQYKDHLGNVRVSFAAEGGVAKSVDTNDYYPFGMNHLKNDGESFFGTSSYKNYKFGAKELQETGFYDFDARFYMPDLGRFGTIDPLSKKSRRWSPYRYAYNNPLRFIDPDGMEEQAASTSNNGTETGTGDGIDRDAGGNEVVRIIGNIPISAGTAAINVSHFGDGGATSETGDPEKTKHKIAKNAKSHADKKDTSYAYNKRKDNFDDTSDKCNKFVYDILKKSGADPGTPNGNIINRMIGRGSPPTAGQWADPNYHIPGWEITTSPKAGDVVAAAHNYSNGATGHVAIMISSTHSVGANATIVRETDFGSNPSHLHVGSQYVYRTYVGNASNINTNQNHVYKQYP
nr:RHS repeat-associated core domain-containing protein [Chryseobacterium sp. R2A-55]